MLATRALRMRSLVYRPNYVMEKQRLYQADHRDVYLIQPRSKLYLATACAMLTVTVGGGLHGIYKFIRGTAKE